MATTVFGKIAPKTQKMSLNERFQLLRQNQTRRTQNNANTNKIINRNQTALQLRQGSQKNRRLALQMANRPSVIAALRANNSNNNNNNNSQGIKQRLGNQRFNNQNNNNINAINRNFGQRNINARNRNPNQKPFLNRSNINTVAPNRIRNNLNRNQVRTQFQNRRNNSQNIGVVVGVRQTVRKAIKKNRFRKAQSFKIANPAKASIKQRKRGAGGQLRNQTQNNNKTGGKKFRINRNFNARNSGGQQKQQQQQQKKRNVKPNREQLDNDLDAYMAGTKSYLDAELDAYMSQTN